MDQSVIGLFLPEGLLEYFDITSVKKSADDFTIHLVEKNHPPDEFKDHRLSSKGFYDEVTLNDFPIRGKACFLKVRRRRWLNEDSGKVVSRDWQLVAKGTRMTKEFASFLKAVHRYQSGKL